MSDNVEGPREGSRRDRLEGFLVVLSTVPDRETGTRIAHALVEARLAACVNVVPGLTSIYRWEGAVHEDAELLLVIKTRRALFDALARALAAAHPYEVPEIVALPVEAGGAKYLAWLADSAG